jgi:hypothetical protein
MMYDSMTSGPNRSCTSRIVLNTSNVLRAESVSGVSRWTAAAGRSARSASSLVRSGGPAPRSRRPRRPGVHLLEHLVVLLGVLAHVERGQLQAEGGDRADRRGDQPTAVSCRSCGPARPASAPGRRSARRCRGSRGRARARCRGAAAAGVGQLRLDAAHLEPVRLLGVDPAEPRRDLGQASRSLARLADRSRETPRSRRETDSSSISASIAFSVAWMPCSCWIISTSRVTAGVTNGLPSRSPPIHVPKVSGRDVGAVSTPSWRSVSARSSSTCGAASAYRSAR